MPARRIALWFAATILLVGAGGCATKFSSQKIRNEIVSQTGRQPEGVFEVNVGKLTTTLIKQVVGEPGEGTPLEGLDEIEIAVFDAPSDDGPVIDVTRIKVRGWQPWLVNHDERRSAMLLFRPKSGAEGTLVVVGAGRKKVVYGRLKGRLDPELSTELRQTLQDGGPEEVKGILTGLAEGAGTD
jgi:hypothetical protein